MGRKRFGKRKYLFLCIAGLIFFSLSSCGTIMERPTVLEKEKPVVIEKEGAPTIERATVPGKAKTVIIEKEGCSHLDVLEPIARHEDFETLLEQKQETLSILPKNKPADEILFSLGLLYAHPENPKKNYKKSLTFFKRVINEYPRSVCAAEAKIWAGVLEDIEKAAKVDLEIEQKKKELGK